MRTVLEAIIKAHEIQGVLALENSLNRVGLDHVLFVKVASTAVVTKLLGGEKMKSSTPFPMPGLTIQVFGHIDMLQILVLASRGRLAMQQAALYVLHLWP